jgi:outer membrane lipoprotein-sorting protein
MNANTTFHIALLVTTILLFLLTARAAGAQGLDPEAVLQKIDRVATQASDLTSDAEMILLDASGRRKTRVVRMQQKGDQLRLVQFLAPADVRGVGFLRLSSDRLYLYLPAFRRVRRIASSGLDEDFFGTDFSYEDLAQNRYADDYEPRALTHENGRFVLNMEPRSGSNANYRRLMLEADTSNYVIRNIEYYGRDGTRIKTLAVNDVVQIDGYWIGRKMQMTNLRTGHQTTLSLSEIAFDRGLDEAIFSERSLKRPIR